MRISFTSRCVMLAILLTMFLSSISIIYADFDPEFANILAEFLDKQHDSCRMTMAIILPEQGTWVGAFGMADQEAGIPVVPENLFRIASITKTFTATTTLMLAEEGILTLEDSVEQWLPGLNDETDVEIASFLISRRRSYT